MVAGTLVAPFLAAVVTLVYYRLTAAHGEAPQPAAPGAGYGQPGSYGYGQPGPGPGPADPGDYGQHGPA